MKKIWSDSIDTIPTIYHQSAFAHYWKTCLIDSTITVCLLPLLQLTSDYQALVTRYSQLHPTNPLTLNPVTEEDAEKILRQALTKLEREGYLLIESDIST